MLREYLPERLIEEPPGLQCSSFGSEPKVMPSKSSEESAGSRAGTAVPISIADSPAGGPTDNPAGGRGGMRQRLIRKDRREVLIARLDNSLENADDYTDVNCGGFGRIRKFHRFSVHLRAQDSVLPVKPHYRGLPPVLPYRTQVFQVNGCNWNCWYCFVDDELLVGDSMRGAFLTAEQMIDLYLAEADPPAVLDLSGGQPDLVPEWCLWVMRALDERGLRGKTHVWIDDNLSGRFVRQFLSPEEIAYMASFPNHSRVGCFKGYDEGSFVFNTKAPPSGFSRQFEVMQDLIDDGFDMYAYVTFTSLEMNGVRDGMRDFVDRLQAIHPLFPLRTIPLEIKPYSVTRSREVADLDGVLERQQHAAAAWEEQLLDRFTPAQLSTPYEEISLRQDR
jgi:uncharacterized Fe-S cluster-containing radical SAM superfamily protein